MTDYSENIESPTRKFLSDLPNNEPSIGFFNIRAGMITGSVTESQVVRKIELAEDVSSWSAEEGRLPLNIFRRMQNYDDTSPSIRISNKDQRTISVLRNAISNLKRTLEFNGYYIAFLLDQISEEEFEDIAKKYAVKPKKEVTEDDIVDIKLFIANIRDDFSIEELSDIFEIERKIIEEKL